MYNNKATDEGRIPTDIILYLKENKLKMKMAHGASSTPYFYYFDVIVYRFRVLSFFPIKVH